MNAPKQVTQFVRSNDSIGRITNLEKITPLINSLETIELCHLFDELKEELNKLISSIIPEIKSIWSEASDAIWIDIVEIYLEGFERQPLWDYIYSPEMKEHSEIVVKVGLMLARVTSAELLAYLDEVRDAYSTCSKEIVRRHEKNQKIKRIIITTAAALVGIFIMSKSENVDRFIRFSWEKIYQILSNQE